MTGRKSFNSLRAELTPAQKEAVSAKVIALSEEIVRSAPSWRRQEG